MRPKETRAPRTPEHLPVVRVEIDPLKIQLNPNAFRRIGEEMREQFSFKPAEFFRIQLVRGKFVRKNDPTAKPLINPLPPCLLERCIATPDLITKRFARMGVTIHRKNLGDWALLAAALLSIIYHEIQYEHGLALYRYLDDSSIRYLQPCSGKAQTDYLWTANIPDGTVFCHWHDGRDARNTDGLFEKTEPRRISPLLI